MYQLGGFLGQQQAKDLNNTIQQVKNINTKDLPQIKAVRIRSQVPNLLKDSELKLNPKKKSFHDLFLEELDKCNSAEDFVSFLQNNCKEYESPYDPYSHIYRRQALYKKFSSIPNALLLDILRLFYKRGMHNDEELMLNAAIKSDPIATADYAADIQSSGLYMEIGEKLWVLDLWARRDPEATIEWIKNSQSKIAEGLYYRVFTEMTKKNINRAKELFQSLDSKNRSNALKGIIWGLNNFDDAMTFYDELSNDSEDAKSFWGVMPYRYHQESLEWIDNNSSSVTDDQRKRILQYWMSRDPEKAKDWVLNQSDPEKGYSDLSSSLAPKKDSLKILKENLPAEKYNDGLFNFITSNDFYNENEIKILHAAINQIDSSELQKKAALSYFESIKNSGITALKFLDQLQIFSPDKKLELRNKVQTWVFVDSHKNHYYEKLSISENPKKVYEALKKHGADVAEEYRNYKADLFKEKTK